MKANFFKFFRGNKEDLYSKGVYKISFGNNKCYVGSTTTSFKNRFASHYNHLKNDIHRNKYLSNCFKKYPENIIFEIVEIIDDISIILEREQYWIDFHKTYIPKNGYNISPTAGNTLGFKMYEDIVEKRRKKYLQYDLDGNFIREWNSYTDIKKTFGIFGSKEVLEDSFHSAYGYLWRYKLNETYPLKIDSYEDRTKFKVLMYSIEGVFLKEYDSMFQASIDNNIPVGNISKVLGNNINMAYGYIWKKWKENYPLKIENYEKIHPFEKKIKVTFIETGEIKIFKTKRDMSKKLDINRSSVKHAISKNNGLMTRKKIIIEEI